MTQLSILEHPHEILRQVSRPVDRFDGELRQLVDDLLETLHATGGIGL